MALLFPYGYATPAGGGEQGMGTQRSLVQLMNYATVSRMHPEFRRRVFALMLFAADWGVPLGIGTAWRSYAQQYELHLRNPSGSAAPGNSNHEGNNQADDKDAIAADMVPSSGQKWQVSDPTILSQFGLIAFHPSSDSRYWNIQGRSYSTSSTREDWHIQPWEVNYSRSGRTWRANLRYWPIPARYDIDAIGLDPDLSQPDPGNAGSWEQFTAARLAERPPGMPNDPLREGSVGQEVYLLQTVLNQFAASGKIPECGNPDGEFGPMTKASLIGLQTVYLALGGDGYYGPVTHLTLQKLSNDLWALSQAPPPAPDPAPAPSDPLELLRAAARQRVDAGQMPAHDLTEGSEGIEVAVLQTVLNDFAVHGLIEGPGWVDGSFGYQTKRSLMGMQGVYLNTTGDGYYGPVTHWNLQVLSNNLRAMG